MRRSESFFTTAEQETIDFSSITDELKRTREFVEPEMKRGFANNIFESATEMEEMMEDDSKGKEDVGIWIQDGTKWSDIMRILSSMEM